MMYNRGYSYGGNNCGRDRGGWNQYGQGNSIPEFISQLSPGITVELQYDDQRPARGTFQGFEGGNVLLTNYNGFPGLVRIALNRVNAIAPFGYGSPRYDREFE